MPYFVQQLVKRKIEDVYLPKISMEVPVDPRCQLDIGRVDLILTPNADGQ